ncbi:hypothetical protein [Burkholderia sp. BCC0405]|nr:hypothetical protein [Burkholderia sp. BCC0405]
MQTRIDHMLIATAVAWQLALPITAQAHPSTTSPTDTVTTVTGR